MHVNQRIWLSPPDVGPRERELLLDAFDSNWIAPLGPHVDGLETELAAATGRQHGAALTSGTAALHLGLTAMGVGPGDIVITASQTFAATANAVVHSGATPVFVDSEAERWAMDPALLDIALTTAAAEGQRVGAVVPVDLYGQCADHERISEVAARHDVPVLSDAAEALGASERGVPAGSHGHAAIVSFNGNKIITGSGGGALVTDDKQLAERVTFLATQAREPARHYEHRVVGHNERMSNLIAAVIRGGLEQLPQKVARRRELHVRYRDALEDRVDVSFPTTPDSSEPNRWLTIIQVADAQVRDHVLDTLAAQDIEARPTWKPMHLQPLYAEHRMYGGEVSEAAFATGICLPSGSSLTDADQDRVIAAVRESLQT
jgi:dTDP-4-amino-4,6-dideoxygalactose transaminase